MKLMQRLRTIFRRRVLVLPEAPPPAPIRWKPSERIVTRAYDTSRPRAPMPRRTTPPAAAPTQSSSDPVMDLVMLNAALGIDHVSSTPPPATDDGFSGGGGSFGGGGASSSWATDTSYDSSPSTSAMSDSYSTSDSGSSYSDSSSSGSSDP